MLRGVPGLETAPIPHADWHGLLHPGLGNLTVENDCLGFVTVGMGDLSVGDDFIPFQAASLRTDAYAERISPSPPTL
jgi:CRISPR-associated protein Cas1